MKPETKWYKLTGNLIISATKVDMQRSKFNLEVQTCSCFSQLKIKIDIKQELNIPAQGSTLSNNGNRN
jgi:hypothetical protein